MLLKNKFKDNKFLLQIILDGYGIGKENYTNAIFKAKKPYLDYLLKNYPQTRLNAHGEFVGLDQKTAMGGSEVGHSTIGAGRIIMQTSSLINQMIQNGQFQKSPTLVKLLKQAQKKSFHLIGLLSDGNVHSHINHLKELITVAAKNQVSKCYVHALLDGRDTPIQSALIYTEEIEQLFSKIKKQNPSYEYSFASGAGREYATMDRAKNWYLIERGWKAHVMGEAEFCFNSMTEAITHFRANKKTLIDQDLPTFNLKTKKGKTISIQDEAAVLFFNFRGDRAIELSQALEDPNFSEFSTPNKPKVFFAAMTVYDETNDKPKNRIIEPPVKKNFFGEKLVIKKKKQFRISETQKYPHITFFYNGGYHIPLEPKLETYHLIESDRPDSFANKPQMKALEITDQTMKFIQSQEYSFGLVNFPNPDMVGHTGDFEAVVKSIEVLDKCLQKICETVRKYGGIVIVTADHGNADEMIIKNSAGEDEISTKHSLNPVPFIIFDNHFNQNYKLIKNSSKNQLGLSQIAATSLILLGEDPAEGWNQHLFQV